MTDQAAAKKIFSELIKREDLNNKVCNDCSNLNPQWASISFAVFLCLQCAGTHRGFGVHISFVRSVSMDTWQDDQIRRMQLGGNAPFREFMRSYTPVEQSGYNDNLSPYDTYHCWAATQYREKLDAALAGKDWVPSPPSELTHTKSRSSSPGPSAQGLRKSRTSARSGMGNSLRSNSPSPSPFKNSPRGTPDLSTDQKTLNESYFESLGRANDNRPTDLPPSQGGRYQGFGNSPNPPASSHPSLGLSSSAAPSLTELQENPMAAISKGWSLFSAAVAGASKAVSENIIQPGVEKVTDPNLQASVMGYMSEAQKKAAAVGSTANQWSKQQFGVDVAESVGGVVGTVKDKMSGGPTRSGYGALATENDAESSGLYNDEDDFFTEHTHGHRESSQAPTQTTSNPKTTSIPAGTKAGDWDEWKDF